MVATSVSMVVQFKPIKKTAITSKKGCDAQLRGCSDPITIVVQHDRPGGDRGKKTTARMASSYDSRWILQILSYCCLPRNSLIAQWWPILGFPQWTMTSNLGTPVSHFWLRTSSAVFSGFTLLLVSSPRVMPSTSMPSPSARCDGPRTTRSPIAHVPRPPRDHRS